MGLDGAGVPKETEIELEMVRRHVREGAERVAHQRGIVAELHADGSHGLVREAAARGPPRAFGRWPAFFGSALSGAGCRGRVPAWLGDQAHDG